MPESAEREALAQERVEIRGRRRQGAMEGDVEWLPPVDIVETADRFEITVELCGVAREDIDVYLDDGNLTVGGMRRADEEGETCHYRERPMGRFARSFSFRSPIDEERIIARLAEGVLCLTIPKKLPQQIPLS
ncbi:MAG: Hsp20/alpha crystallin family protein [Candidatus Zipacnadales bacterium]